MQPTGSPSDWNTYVNGIQDGTRIAYFYAGATNGSGQFTVDPSFFYYTVKHDGGYITLTPVENEAFSSFLTQQGIPWQASHAVIRMPATSDAIQAYGSGNGLTLEHLHPDGQQLVLSSTKTADKFPTMTSQRQQQYEQAGLQPEQRVRLPHRDPPVHRLRGRLLQRKRAAPIPDAMGLTSGAPRVFRSRPDVELVRPLCLRRARSGRRQTRWHARLPEHGHGPALRLSPGPSSRTPTPTVGPFPTSSRRSRAPTVNPQVSL